MKPTVTVCSSSITVTEGEAVTCLCTGHGGNPPANVAWYDKNNVQIGGIRKDENLLTLRNVTKADGGTYRCVAESHPAAKDEESIEVTVNCKYTTWLSNLNQKLRYLWACIECITE